MDKENASFSLNYLPLLIRLKCCKTSSLPEHLGSTLHGIVGWALAPHERAYQYIFENRRLGGGKQDIANPYILELPRYRSIYREGDELCFGFVLIGNAAQYAEELIHALVEKKEFGLGAERNPFELVEILQGRNLRPIWHQEQLNMANAAIEMMTNDIQKSTSHCSVHLLTPLRIRRNGELLTKVDFSTIIRSITRKIVELTERYGGYVNMDEIACLNDRAASIQQASVGLYVSQINRYSNRKRETMNWDGLLGAMTFEGELSPFVPWLYAAQILHIGRNVTFGCGKIDVIFG